MNTRMDLTGRENNLNILRFCAALLVIYSHSYVLTGAGVDGIARVTGGQTSGGQLAVLLFFFYGGLLIMKSAERKKSARAFFSARALRIFPALWIVIICSAFILGPILSIFPLSEYLHNGETWKYLLNGLLIPVHKLPGVFLHNPGLDTVNGALWTLPVEFACYIMCYTVYRLELMRGKRFILTTSMVAVCAVGAWIVLRPYPVLQNAVLPVLFFYLGMTCWKYREKIPNSGFAALGALLLLCLSAVINCFLFGCVLFYPYILLYLAFGTKIKFSGFGSRMELSYAIYLTAFPIQQILVSLNTKMEPIFNFLLASCLSVIVAVIITGLTPKPSRAKIGK